jgi:hypothetical protein
MKTKSIVLSFILITLTAAGTYAQGFHLGIKGGTNIYKIDGRSFDEQFKYGYSLGGFAEINFSKHFGIQPEVMWNQANARTADNIGTVVDGATTQNITLNYLSIPLLLNIRPTKVLSILVGPQYGILINESDNLFNNGKNAFKKGDFSMVGGVQLNLTWFKVGARYFVGLNDIKDVTADDKWKNQGLQLYVGIRII